MTTHRSTNRDEWLSAPEAASRLGVKRATLYTYASRGWVRTRADGGRTRRYHAADVALLVERAAAHTGRGPRAAGALHWGEPVLETAVSAIDADGPYYRGVAALDLVETPLERVAERLWDTPASPWPDVRAPAADDLLDLRRRIDALAAEDPERALWQAPAELERARRIVATLRSAARLPDHPDLHAALVLCADHGLNASTFTARVVASTGADLYACVSAGLAALSGPKHGTASVAVFRLIEDFESRGPTAVLDRARDTGALPGFGHPLYPAGDPRAEALLERCTPPRLAALLAAVEPLGLRPNLDVGLLAVCLGHGLPARTAPLLFAAGRSTGWIAHVLEQRTRPGILRPRASYTGW